MTLQNLSFASPLADAKYAQILGNPQINGFLAKVSDLSAWTIALTILLVLVAYDQCKYPSIRDIPITTAANTSKVSYIIQKGTIVGPAWKAPFIGPFLQSMNPKWEEYKGKWASGELSCVSVFHKYVFAERPLGHKVLIGLSGSS